MSFDSTAATDHGDDIDYVLMGDMSTLDAELRDEDVVIDGIDQAKAEGEFLIPSTLSHISTFSVMYYVSLPAFLLCIPVFAALGLYLSL